MPRPNRAFVGLCIAVVALSALVPGIGILDDAVFQPRWIQLPDATPGAAVVAIVRSGEQPVPLLSLLPSRAPPRSLA
jgi:hypothetical protein